MDSDAPVNHIALDYVPMIAVTCPHCGEVVDLEDGHSSWICPKCRGYIEAPWTRAPHNED